MSKMSENPIFSRLLDAAIVALITASITTYTATKVIDSQVADLNNRVNILYNQNQVIEQNIFALSQSNVRYKFKNLPDMQKQ